MKKHSTEKRDVHQEITNKMIAMLEAGNIPWQKPWKDINGMTDGLMPYNAVSRNNYSGINLLLLWADSSRYGSNAWMTYKQAQQLGGNVKKGEKSTEIIYFKKVIKEDKKTGEKSVFPMLRYYYVFNAAQCENVKLPALKTIEPPTSAKSAVIEIAQAHTVDLRHGGNRAFFSPSHDFVQMPHFNQFKTEEDYSATLAHELTHWTGHKSRLDRKMSSMLDLDGSEYAKEELIAELGSAFLCAELGIQHNETQTAAYLQSWLKGLRNDKRFIFQAATAASKATNYLQKRLPEQIAEEAEEELSEEQLKLNTENKEKVLALLA